MQLNSYTQMEPRLNPVLPGMAAMGNSQVSDRLVFQFVPMDGIGTLVQSCLRAGIKKVSVTPNRGGNSCTLTLEC